MVPDWNAILGWVGLLVVVIGGFIQLRLNLAKQIAALKASVDEINLRLELEEKHESKTANARRLEIAEIARAEIVVHRAECARRPVKIDAS